MLSQALGIFDMLVRNNSEGFINISSHLLYIGFPFSLLWGPSLFLYTKSIVNQDFFNSKHLLFFIPFLIVISYLSIVFYFNNSSEKIMLYYTGLGFPTFLRLSFIFIHHIIIFSCIIGSFYQTKKLKQKLKDKYSSTDEINVSWLQSFLIFYTTAWILSALQPVVQIYDSQYFDMLHILVMIVFLIFYSVIVYKTVFNYNIFVDDPPKLKYAGSPLTTDKRDLYRNAIINFLENEKPYKKNNIKIEDLASGVKLPVWTVSQIINQSFNKNFFDLINKYRIEESKKKLADNSNNQTILEILYECGFNSKSAFNRAFKKHERMTPTEYKHLFSSK